MWPPHVATHENNNWSGTRTAPNADGSDGPFATLFRARDEARKRIAGGLEGGLTIRIHGGVYRLWKSLVLDPRDGGSEAHEGLDRSAGRKARDQRGTAPQRVEKGARRALDGGSSGSEGRKVDLSQPVRRRAAAITGPSAE